MLQFFIGGWDSIYPQIPDIASTSRLSGAVEGAMMVP